MLEFEFVQVAVGNRDKFLCNPSEIEWKRLFYFAQKQSLVGVLFCAIERLPNEQRPKRDLLLKWYAMAEKIRRTNAKLNMRCAELTTILKEGGFKDACLKVKAWLCFIPSQSIVRAGILICGSEHQMVSLLQFLQ